MFCVAVLVCVRVLVLDFVACSCRGLCSRPCLCLSSSLSFVTV